MSKNFMSKEDAINQLYATIKTKFEQEGVLQEVRCMLQSKMVAMMKGKSDAQTSLVGRTPPSLTKLNIGRSSHNTSGDASASDGQRDPRIQLLHQLIMEYFHWHGFHYAAEMFAMESASDNTRPTRESLEGMVGPFEHKTVPILLEMVAQLMEQKKS